MAGVMEIDEDARRARYKTRVSRYEKNIVLLREMAEIEELDGFKTQILNLAESYVRLIESIDRWEGVWRINLHCRLLPTGTLSSGEMRQTSQICVGLVDNRAYP